MKIELKLREQLAAVKDQAKRTSIFRVFVIYDGPFEDLDLGDIILRPTFGKLARGKLTADEIEALAAVPGIVRIELPPSESRDLKDSVPSMHVNTAWTLRSPELRGNGVIVAVIDSGIDVTHEAFQNSDGTTRIIALWDQTFEYNSSGAAVYPLGSGEADDVALTGDNAPRDELGAVLTQGSNRAPSAHIIPPATVVNAAMTDLDYGAEFTRAQINTALQRNRDTDQAIPISLVDNPAAGNHGTHVAGIAAGDGSPGGCCTSGNTYVGVAPEADILVVKTGLDSDGVVNIKDAIEYALRKARTFPGGARPVVLNLSLGRDTGHHNGFSSTSQFTTAIMSGSSGEAIVRSAGNSRNDNIHAALTISAGDTESVDFTVGAAESKVSFWMSYQADADFTFKFKLPGSGTRDESRGIDNTDEADFDEHGHTFAPNEISIELVDPDEHHQFRIRNATSGNFVASGTWTLEITNNDAAEDLNLHIWTKYSKFENPGDSVPENWLKATLGVDATGPDVIAVAAHSTHESPIKISDFSSQGPAPTDLADGLFNVVPSNPNKPEVSAPGVGIMSAKAGAFASEGCCACCVGPETNYIPMNGTSQASPHVAGVAALMLQADPTLTHTQIKQMLRDTADTPPSSGSGSGPAEELFGAGPVNAQDAVQAVLDNLATARVGAMSSRRNPLSNHPVVQRLSSLILGWEQRFGSRPSWHFFASLVGTHFVEVQTLINTQRKVGAVWQRFGGPHLVRSVVFAERDIDPPIPLEVGANRMDVLVNRMIPVLRRFAGPRLMSDITRYEDLALHLPGRKFDDIDALVTGGRV